MLTRRHRSNSLLGALLIAAGIILIIGTLGWADVSTWYRWLPVVLIVAGAYQLYLNQFQVWIGPLLLIGIGTALLLATLEVISWAVFGALWPLLIIAFGASILLGRSHRGVAGDSADRLSSIAFLGSTKRRITTTTFRGGDITSFMGGVELDFRDAAVAERPAVLNINTLMGGVDLTVPDSWIVDVRITALLGGVEDKRRGGVAPEQGDPHLVVTGLVMMGSVNVKS